MIESSLMKDYCSYKSTSFNNNKNNHVVTKHIKIIQGNKCKYTVKHNTAKLYSNNNTVVFDLFNKDVNIFSITISFKNHQQVFLRTKIPDF